LCRKFKRTDKLWEQISNYSNEVNIQKSITFLYTNNEQMEFKIKNTISFTLALTKNEILWHMSSKIQIVPNLRWYNLLSCIYQKKEFSVSVLLYVQSSSLILTLIDTVSEFTTY
jgi:hypothetical protein